MALAMALAMTLALPYLLVQQTYEFVLDFAKVRKLYLLPIFCA